MRLSIILSTFILAIGFLGCSLISAKTNKKQDLYMRSFTCDSLGVEETVFGRNEKWYACLIIRNNSKDPIEYKVLRPVMLEVYYFKFGGKPSIKGYNDLDPEGCQLHILNPHEQIAEIRECQHDSNVKAGKYNTNMYYFTYFLDDKYEKNAYRQLRHYIPFYVR